MQLDTAPSQPYHGCTFGIGPNLWVESNRWCSEIFHNKEHNTNNVKMHDYCVFKGHLCQTINNFVKHNSSNQLIKHIRNTRVTCIPTFDEPYSATLLK